MERKWVLEGRQIQYFILQQQFGIQTELCPNSGLLNLVPSVINVPHPVTPRDTKKHFFNVISLFYEHSPGARNNEQEAAPRFQPASHVPPAMAQSTTPGHWLQEALLETHTSLWPLLQ